jgi:cyclase
MTLLFDHGVLHRTKNFKADYRYSQSFLGTQYLDEVFLIDISRDGPSSESHRAMSDYAEKCFVPVTMGGWIRSIDDIKRFLDMGTDNIVLKRGATQILIDSIVRKYGSQICAVGIDVDETSITADKAAEMARQYDEWGAGEIFLQSVPRDGSLGGYDLGALRKVLDATTVPVVIGGGCGGWAHMRQAFDAGAAGATTTVIHHMTDAAMRGFKSSLAEYVRPL